MLRARLNEELKQALKANEKIAVSTLRLILAALKDRDLDARAKGNCDGVAEEEILELLQKMIRQRRDSIEAYRNGDRPDLVERETSEIEVIKRFLPKELDEAEVVSAVDNTIEELSANSIKDMGKVIGALKQRYAGRMDFAKASRIAKQRLA
ncbi:MAG: GatB/YqeY domain-containing protein [Kiloniellales bacterium]|nr:GatB/YqeY domain-containing protein [Kiloniellales bacterium]